MATNKKKARRDPKTGRWVSGTNHTKTKKNQVHEAAKAFADELVKQGSKKNRDKARTRLVAKVKEAAQVTLIKTAPLTVKTPIKLVVARPSGPKDKVDHHVRIFTPEYRRARDKRVFIFTDSMIHCNMKGLVQHPTTKQWLCRVFKGQGAKQQGLALITQLRKEGHDCTMVTRNGYKVVHDDMTHSFAPIAGLAGQYTAPDSWSA